MAKWNVYLSDDLKRRMDKVSDVSWSQVASEAFELKLGEFAEQKKEKKMTDVIQRLRASQIVEVNETNGSAFAAGQKWARDTATASQLRRLAEHRKAARREGLDTFSAERFAANCFVEVISPELAGDTAAFRAFWKSVMVGESEHAQPVPPYVQRFADGAVSLWNAVADKL